MIRLEKRPNPSVFWSRATPLMAVALTMVAGGLMFAALGKNPFEALRAIFWEPLFGEFAFYFRGQLLVKAGPLRFSKGRDRRVRVDMTMETVTAAAPAAPAADPDRSALQIAGIRKPG